jgi:hypothetical protein
VVYKKILEIINQDTLLSNLILINPDLNNINIETDFTIYDILFNECDLDTLLNKYTRLNNSYTLNLFLIEYLYYSILLLETNKTSIFIGNDKIQKLDIEDRYRIICNLTEYTEYIENYYPVISSLSYEFIHNENKRINTIV